MAQRKADWLEQLAGRFGLKMGQVALLKLLLLVAGVGVVLIYGERLTGGTVNRPPPADATLVEAGRAPRDELTALEEGIARSLERTLASIEGAGHVEARVTLESTPTVMPFYKTQEQTGTTREKAQDGSTRETTQNNNSREVIVQNTGGGTDVMPVMKRERAAVSGVLIVAEGARHDAIRAQLLRATATALGIPAHRIEVTAMKAR